MIAPAFEWLDVQGGDYEIGLRAVEAHELADLAARQAREGCHSDPDLLHPEREALRLAEMWGNPEFLYAQLAHSMPSHHVTLPSFAITAAPVSAAAYTAFQKETGAAAPVVYSSGGTQDPSGPITGVSWSEAFAFAAWAGYELAPEAMWEAALRPPTRSPFGTIGHELYEWCADEFGPYPGADLVALDRITPPPGGWTGTRTRRGGVISGFPVTVVGRRGANAGLRLRDTTFRLVRR